MKHSLLLCLGLCLAATAQAQTNFQPGYVVTLTGDTLRGQVDSRGVQRNARLSRFRPAETAPVTEYRPTQLRGYGLTGDRVYQTGQVMLADSVKRRSLLDVRVSEVLRPAFLEVLVLGPASLLYLRDVNNQDHYYVRVGADGAPQELVATATTTQVNGTDYKQQSDEYKRTLAAALKGCLAVQPQINALKYTESELIKVVRRYNECVGGTSVAPAAASRQGSARLALVAGAQRSDLHYFDVSNDTKFELGTSPVVGLALQMSLAGLNRAISARVEALYTSGSGSGEVDYRDGFGDVHRQNRIELRTIHVPLLVRYTFPRGSIRPFAQLGYSGSYFLKAQNEYRDQYVNGVFAKGYSEWKPIIGDSRVFEVGPTGGLGLSTAKEKGRNLALELRYARTNGFSENPVTGTRINRYFLLLSYDLTK